METLEESARALQYVLELIGIVAFAVSGAMAGIRENTARGDPDELEPADRHGSQVTRAPTDARTRHRCQPPIWLMDLAGRMKFT